MTATLPVSYTSVSRIHSSAPPISSIAALSSSMIADYAGGVEAEINARLSKRYALPFTVDCPLLTALATREAIFAILVERLLIHFPPAQQGKHPLQLRHESDQKLLEAIAEGEVQLVNTSGQVIEADLTQSEIYSTTMDYLPTFNEGPFEDTIQDQRKLDDLEDDFDTKANV